MDNNEEEQRDEEEPSDNGEEEQPNNDESGQEESQDEQEPSDSDNNEAETIILDAINEIETSVFVAIVDLPRGNILWVLNKEGPVYNKDGSIKFIKPEGWGLPGGGKETEDQNELYTAERETREEAGLEVGHNPDNLEECHRKLEHEDHYVTVFATTKFHGELKKKSRETKEAKWFPIYEPPKNAYLSHLRRYRIAVNYLRAKGVLR